MSAVQRVPVKQPTPQAVSRLLAAAGFGRAVTGRMGVPGFRVRAEGPRVLVSWYPGSLPVYATDAQRQAREATGQAMAGTYAQAMERAGYATRVDAGTVYVLAAEEAVGASHDR